MLGSEDTSFRCLVESFPRLLLLSPESHMKALVKYLENIGVSSGCTRNVLLLFSPIIFCKVEVIKARVQAFKEVGVEDKDFGKVLIKYLWILSTSIQENYKEFLSFFEMEKIVIFALEDFKANEIEFKREGDNYLEDDINKTQSEWLASSVKILLLLGYFPSCIHDSRLYSAFRDPVTW